MGDEDTSRDTSTVQLTVEQAARAAGVSTKTIRRWLTSGRLAASREGAAYVIDRAELERAMSNGHPADARPVASRGNGHIASMSIVQELLDRLERQAGEIVALRLERDELSQQLLALQAPKETNGHAVLAADELSESERQELEVLRAEHQVNLRRLEPPKVPPETKQRPWWRLW